MATQPHPPLNGNQLPIPSAPTPPNRWAHLAFTFIPFFIYVLAERIPLPTVVNFDYAEYAGASPGMYSIAAVGIMPWIIAIVIVEIVGAILPNSWQVRHKRVIGRTYLQWATNIVGFHIAAWQALVTLSRMTVVPPGLYVESPMGVGIFLPKPYATSPALVFIGLVAGAVFVRLLAEFVTIRGLVSGYAVFFTGELLISTLRMIGRGNQSPEWMDTLKLMGSVLSCTVLTLFVLAKLRPARRALESDKAKDELIDDARHRQP